jgi:hypothetical protein
MWREIFRFETMRRLKSVKTFMIIFMEDTPQTQKRDLVDPGVAWSIENTSDVTASSDPEWLQRKRLCEDLLNNQLALYVRDHEDKWRARGSVPVIECSRIVNRKKEDLTAAEELRLLRPHADFTEDFFG